MTLTEYYVRNKRALHDVDTAFGRQHFTQGTIRYADGDLQVYSDEGWVSFRRIMSEAPWRNAKLN